MIISLASHRRKKILENLQEEVAKIGQAIGRLESRLAMKATK